MQVDCNHDCNHERLLKKQNRCDECFKNHNHNQTLVPDSDIGVFWVWCEEDLVITESTWDIAISVVCQSDLGNLMLVARSMRWKRCYSIQLMRSLCDKRAQMASTETLISRVWLEFFIFPFPPIDVYTKYMLVNLQAQGFFKSALKVSLFQNG